MFAFACVFCVQMSMFGYVDCVNEKWLNFQIIIVFVRHNKLHIFHICTECFMEWLLLSMFRICWIIFHVWSIIYVDLFEDCDVELYDCPEPDTEPDPIFTWRSCRSISLLAFKVSQSSLEAKFIKKISRK